MNLEIRRDMLIVWTCIDMGRLRFLHCLTDSEQSCGHIQGIQAEHHQYRYYLGNYTRQSLDARSLRCFIFANAIFQVLMFRSVGSIIFGIAADRYGRKWPFIINNLLFIVLELVSSVDFVVNTKHTKHTKLLRLPRRSRVQPLAPKPHEAKAATGAWLQLDGLGIAGALHNS